MIEWAKAGREILARRKDINPTERDVMLSHVRAAEQMGSALSQRQFTDPFRIPERDWDAVNKAFEAQYGHEHTINEFSYDLRTLVVIDAPQAAIRFNHNYIGTEHILLALVQEGCPIQPLLNKLGLDQQKVESAIQFIIGRGEREVKSRIDLTPRARKVIDLALEEARGMNQSEATCEHLLLGLVKEGEGIATGIVDSLGISLDNIREAVIATQRTEDNGRQ